MANYIGITIGPIYSTMELTSSPVGLWGASYLFSSISRDLCIALVREGIPAESFLAPYFLMKDEALILSDEAENICEKMRGKGVGMFHDRIIFRSQDIHDALDKVKKARESVINQLGRNLQAEMDKNPKTKALFEKSNCTGWLRQYIRILAAEVSVKDGESPLVELGKVLSALELEPQFPSSERNNSLLSLFENSDGESGYKNTVLKASFLRKEVGEQWMLYKQADENGENIRNLKSLACQDAEKADIKHKYQQYYAVLKSDGDSMGEILKSCKSDKGIRDYSEKCLTFCAEAAKIVQDFGGMPIYAGGDDLLVLLPVVGANQKSVFSLIEKLRAAFNTNFKEERERLGDKPTISFGVAVQYYKSPLYEALERADSMLRKAKSTKDKNACYMNIQKHSGQVFELFETKMDTQLIEETEADSTVKHYNLFGYLDKLIQIIMSDARTDDKIKFLSGAGYQVEAYRSMFCMAAKSKGKERSDRLDNLYANLFDNTDQKQFDTYLDMLKTLTKRIFEEQAGTGSEDAPKRCVDLTSAAIRAIHFMNEKKEED